jgi:hypothetical protein
MAFFSLTDIKYIPGQDRQFNVDEDRFGIDNKRYPIDVGAADKAHYMMISIFRQERTQVKGYTDVDGTSMNQQDLSGRTNAFDALGDLITNGKERLNDFVNTQTASSITDKQSNSEDPDSLFNSKNFVGSITSNLSKVASIANELGFINRANFFHTVKKTSDTIALYMPDTLQYDYHQNYSDVSVAKDAGIIGLAAQAGASILDRRNTSDVKTSIQNLSPFIADAFKSKIGGESGFTAFTAATGGVLASNPQLELIYQSPQFRNFRFSFMFYPRSQKEAQQVLGIIDTLRFHQAPEVLASSYGRFLVPPSEFEINFYYNGEENPNIPKITTCVLTDISVDYAPSGFASYETLSNSPSRGGTGMPVAIRMDLAFKETEIITKQFLSKERSNYRLYNLGESGVNGLDSTAGELRTQEQIEYSNSLKSWDETNPDYGTTGVTTATAPSEFNAAYDEWGSLQSPSVNEDGED